MATTFWTIDTETTGLADGCGLVAIGLVLMRDGRIEHRQQLLCHPRPGAVVEPQALAVNGYDQAEWDQRGAVDEASAVIDATIILDQTQAPIWAHNAEYDRRMLQAAADAIAGDAGHPATSLARRLRHLRCSRHLARYALDALGLPTSSASLRTACATLGLPGPADHRGLHGALDDAIATAGLVHHLLTAMRTGILLP